MKKILSFKNPNEFRVGVFILVPLLILFLFIILKLGYSLSGSTIDVYLKTDSISAIKKGTAIKLKGYDIGRIVELKPVYKPSLHFLATMRLKKNIELQEDCTALILNQNIIGDTIIELRNPEIKSYPLRDGDVIEGLEYVNLEAVLTDLHKLLNNINDTVGVVKNISIESRQNIRGMLTDLGGSVSSVNSILANSQKDILAIMQAFRETATTMQQISAEIKKRPLGFIMKGSKEEEKPVTDSSVKK